MELHHAGAGCNLQGGRDAIGKTLKELEGYIIRRQLRGKDGRISDTEYTIFEKPRKTTPPDTTLPDTENPYLDTQLFNLLCEKADDVYGGRLPVHVRCLIDEAANIGQIPRLEKLLATIRSREISCCLVLQAQSQLKALYKDSADTIIGNMDCSIFLGGKEPGTLKELAEALGKETIDSLTPARAVAMRFPIR